MNPGLVQAIILLNLLFLDLVFLLVLLQLKNQAKFNELQREAFMALKDLVLDLIKGTLQKTSKPEKKSKK